MHNLELSACNNRNFCFTVIFFTFVWIKNSADNTVMRKVPYGKNKHLSSPGKSRPDSDYSRFVSERTAQTASFQWNHSAASLTRCSRGTCCGASGAPAVLSRTKRVKSLSSKRASPTTGGALTRAATGACRRGSADASGSF